MKKSLLSLTLVGIALLGLTLPAIASAGWFNWGCRYQGTWFGVAFEDDPSLLSGWVVTVEGKSFFYGTNNVEFTAVALDPRLPDPYNPGEFFYNDAVKVTTNRGNWIRTGYNTFAYTMTGFGLDAFGVPLYVATANGTITLSDDCNRAVITADALFYDVVHEGVVFPLMPNPFIVPNDFVSEAPINIEFPDQYAYRAFVAMP